MTRALRLGAAILFGVAVVVFVSTLTYQLLMMGDIQHAATAGTYEGTLPPLWLVTLAAIGGALSAAAVPFFGACVIDRIDRLLAHREAAE
jgi:hypothetical protein